MRDYEKPEKRCPPGREKERMFMFTILLSLDDLRRESKDTDTKLLFHLFSGVIVELTSLLGRMGTQKNPLEFGDRATAVPLSSGKN